MLRRKEIIDKIIQCLSILQNYIKMQNANKCFDINIYCEDFFSEFLNILFDIKLENLNELITDFPAVDLGDCESGICYQVTVTNDIKKIESTLEKFKEKKLYKQYDEINILILGEKRKYTKKLSYNEFEFDIKDNIIDFKDLSIIISKNKNKNKIEQIYGLLEKNLIKFGAINGESYLSSIVTNNIKIGTSCKLFIQDYMGYKAGSVEEATTMNDIISFANKLSKLDTNTREVIKAIIDIREKENARGRKYDKVYFYRPELYKYLKIGIDTLNNELGLLYKKKYIDPVEDTEDDTGCDILYCMSDDNEWDVLFTIVDFCYENDRDVSDLILNLNFTILD
ncbi:SMEK domain-containing protein [Clostridium tagluense]|uniref:SMEK domain-containing protein n=1 Tax=Clostridium tagluense TaxID=360422 RepID=UPI001CF2A587|nr:SMEK domain-containing protein [Clostridium tagluense]MCB2299861.1 SMEK domain-containing protein [Clostridium tagluense]